MYKFVHAFSIDLLLRVCRDWFHDAESVMQILAWMQQTLLRKLCVIANLLVLHRDLKALNDRAWFPERFSTSLFQSKRSC